MRYLVLTISIFGLMSSRINTHTMRSIGRLGTLKTSVKQSTPANKSILKASKPRLLRPPFCIKLNIPFHSHASDALIPHYYCHHFRYDTQQQKKDALSSSKQRKNPLILRQSMHTNHHETQSNNQHSDAKFNRHSHFPLSTINIHIPFQGDETKDKTQSKAKTMKKIVLFTSDGGYGHMSATHALQQYIGDEYEIKPILFFKEIVGSLEPINFITMGRLTAEDMYNALLRRKHFWLLNLICKIGAFSIKTLHNRIQMSAEEFLKQENPDLVISVIPYVNGILLKATQNLNIPFIVIPTDLDNTTFIQGIQNPTHPAFRYCIAFNDSTIKRTMEHAQLKENQLVTGFPLRMSFFKEKDRTKLKQVYGITDKRPVVLLMLGGIGSCALVPFVKELSSLDQPAHIIACIGKSSHLKQPLQNIPLAPHLTLHIQEFTQSMSDLMAIADVMITKSGSVSVCEGIYSGLPLVLDATTNVLTWERLNHAFIQKHHLGYILRDQEQLSEIIGSLLQNKERMAAIKKNLKTMEQKNAATEIKKVVDALIN